MQEKEMQLLEQILDPAPEYSMMPFWFLNDDLKEEELERQLKDFKAKGVSGVVMHPRMGVPEHLQYLSDRFMELMVFIVKTAADLGMQVILYDEGMYPSGSAHGQVVRENPEFASRGITLVKDPAGREIVTRLADGRYIVADFSGGTIRGIHFGEDDGEANAPPSANLLDPEPVECFIRLTHERYYEYLAEYFGNTIIGFFTDEPNILGRNPKKDFFGWTDALADEIVQAGGRLEDLAALFTGEENATTRIFRAALIERLNEVYYRRLSEWCADHGISLMGHPAQSDDIDEEKYFQIPGQDLIMRKVSPEKGGIHGMESVQGKCSADAARHLGRQRNSNECFGMCGQPDNLWHLTSGDLKWFIDWLGVRGVNLFIPHAFYYSLAGERKNERPPDVGPGNIWWPHYRYFADYVRRLSFIMTDSMNQAKVAVICSSGQMISDELAPFFENQVEFNYLPRWLLPEMGPDRELTVAGYNYPYYIADEELDYKAKRINSWQEAGERDFQPDRLQPGLRLAHLLKDGSQLYLFSNEAEEELEVEGTLAAQGVPLAIDLWQGKARLADASPEGDGTRISFKLARRQTLLLMFFKNEPAGLAKVKEPAWLDLDFKLASEQQKDYKKVYEAVYEAESINGCEHVRIQAEEMVECFVNDQLAGVSFWNPHELDIGPFLQAGKNIIRLVVTGSAANRFGQKAVPYGLEA